MAVREKKPILFGLVGDPLSGEPEAATVEEALELAKAAKRTRYLKALEREAEFVILPDVEKAQQELFVAKTTAEVEECVRAGAQVTARDAGGRTPLHFASWVGHADVVEQLLSRGAEINARDYIGRTPLHLASSTGHAAVAEVLLAHGASVNAHDYIGRTPLHYASRHGRADMVELLLAWAADATARDTQNKKPITVAVDNGHSRVVERLAREE